MLVIRCYAFMCEKLVRRCVRCGGHVAHSYAVMRLAGSSGLLHCSCPPASLSVAVCVCLGGAVSHSSDLIQL